VPENDLEKYLSFGKGVCEKYFAACCGEIFFGWRHLFPDFPSQNQEKDVSIQTLFGAKRQEKPF